MVYCKLQVLLNKLNADMFARGKTFDSITVKKKMIFNTKYLKQLEAYEA